MTLPSGITGRGDERKVAYKTDASGCEYRVYNGPHKSFDEIGQDALLLTAYRRVGSSHFHLWGKDGISLAGRYDKLSALFNKDSANGAFELFLVGLSEIEVPPVPTHKEVYVPETRFSCD